jgi:hypothetical protein
LVQTQKVHRDDLVLSLSTAKHPGLTKTNHLTTVDPPDLLCWTALFHCANTVPLKSLPMINTDQTKKKKKKITFIKEVFRTHFKSCSLDFKFTVIFSCSLTSLFRDTK